MNIRSVCVYCASSPGIDQTYFDAATKLGILLAQNNLMCVCGAGNQGLMREVSDAVLQSGGKVTGIIPRFMYEEGWHHKNLTTLSITDTIHERKKQMAELSDAIVALPGGCGTMEELLEIITWKQLGIFTGPIVILNTNNYYTPLIDMLKKAIIESFMRKEHEQIWSVTDTPEKTIEQILFFENKPENPRLFA
ncbi:MAG: TIGR00730 family Rossman fold protein [Candidatus Azobacteroides sp.]|jgi:uncharacterized protein (TIGR00730 family)|nr:TIGR00730 family Rossman fold protein [Candidatus Azobacteroides sp.]